VHGLWLLDTSWDQQVIVEKLDVELHGSHVAMVSHPDDVTRSSSPPAATDQTVHGDATLTGRGRP
jgi:hypothetical protein